MVKRHLILHRPAVHHLYGKFTPGYMPVISDCGIQTAVWWQGTKRHTCRKCKNDFNILPEAAKYLADRDIVEVAKTTVFNCKPDAVCVSGLTAGAQTNTQVLARVKEAVPDMVVLANTGCRPETIENQLSIADGAVVGTTFKVDGKFENEVDESRVKNFMEVVKNFRN